MNSLCPQRPNQHEDGLGDRWGEDDEPVEICHEIIHQMERAGFDIDLERGPVEGTTYLEQQASTPTYTGSKESRLTFIIRYLSWQAKNKVSDIAMDSLFESMRDHVAPSGRDSKGNVIQNNMPASRGEARRVIREVGFDYETIDACPCDNFLYYGRVNGALTRCPLEDCKLPRYRSDLQSKTVPQKKMHYFPITPRLVALFKSPKYSKLMQWAGNNRSNDGWLRYPQDGLAWKRLEELCPFILEDCRNIVFGLATDGFNPFGSNSASHSTWPVVLIMYNLPPELAIKAQNLLLTILIPGKHTLSQFNLVLLVDHVV